MTKTNPINEGKKPRIIVLDSLRGFALFGMVITHYLHFYYGNLLPFQIENSYLHGTNKLILNLDYQLIVNKFYIIFCFLFGVSFSIQRKTFINKKESFTNWYTKRMIILFIIGFIHHIFWKSEILMTYPPLAMILLAIHNLNKKWILIFAIILLSGFPTLIIRTINEPKDSNEINYNSIKQRNKEEKFYLLQKQGTFIENTKSNLVNFEEMINYLIFSGRLLVTLGSFLLGSYLGDISVFDNIIENRNKILKYLGICSLILLSLFLLRFLFKGSIIYQNQNSLKESFSLTLYDLFNLIFSFWYILGFCFLFTLPFGNKLLKSFSPVGKMAITNYLLQSAFGIILFYGYGLGFLMKTSAIENIGLAIGVLLIEIIISHYWLKKHTYGPIEWVWRYFTQKYWWGR